MAIDKTYFEIEIDTEKAQKKLDTLIESANQLAKTNKTASSGGNSSNEEKKQLTEIEKLEEQLTKARSDEAKKAEELRQKIAQANNERKAEVRQATAAKGSYNALSAEYSKLKIQINAMSEAERNTAKGKEMIDHSRELYEQMKKLQEETGKAQLNVGNYKSALEGASGALSAMGGPAATAANGFKSMVSAAKAFIATPIGAVIAVVVSALGLMKKALSSTAEGQKKLATITGVLKGALNGIVEVLVQCGELLYDLFTGNWKGVAENASQVKDAFLNIGNVAKTTGQISAARAELEQEEAKFAETEAKLNKVIAEQNYIARDTRNSSAVREAALKKVHETEEKITNEEIKFQKRKIALLEMEQSLTSNDAEANAELSQEKAHLVDLETELINKKTATLELENNITKQATTTTKTDTKDAEQRLKNQQTLETQLATQKRNNEKQNLEFLQGDEKAYYEERLRLLDEWLAQDIEKENARFNQQVANAATSGEKMEDIQALHDANILALHNQHLSDMQAADDKYNETLDAQYEKEQENKEKVKKADEALKKSKIQAATATMDALGSILEKQGENNKAAFNASKILQASSATVNGIQGAIGAYDQAVASYPAPYGAAIGAASAAAVAASTAASVANIMQQQWNSSSSSSTSAASVTPSASITTTTDTTNSSILDRISARTETETATKSVLVVDEVTAKQKQISNSQKIATI